MVSWVMNIIKIHHNIMLLPGWKLCRAHAVCDKMVHSCEPCVRALLARSWHAIYAPTMWGMMREINACVPCVLHSVPHLLCAVPALGSATCNMQNSMFVTPASAREARYRHVQRGGVMKCITCNFLRFSVNICEQHWKRANLSTRVHLLIKTALGYDLIDSSQHKPLKWDQVLILPETWTTTAVSTLLNTMTDLIGVIQGVWCNFRTQRKLLYMLNYSQHFQLTVHILTFVIVLSRKTRANHWSLWQASNTVSSEQILSTKSKHAIRNSVSPHFWYRQVCSCY